MDLEFLIFYVALCVVAGIAGRNRRIGFWGFLFCSVIFTPFISLAFLFFAAPQKAGHRVTQTPSRGQ
jgi:hypothetical protein